MYSVHCLDTVGWAISGIRLVKNSASLGMMVNVSVRATNQSSVWIQRLLACPVKTLRIRIAAD